MARTKRDSAKERGWRRTIKRQADSGLSVREFCRRQKIRESAFYFWRRTIRRRDEDRRSASGGPAFVPATVTDEPDRDASIAMELASGHVLRLPVTISAAWLAELIDAIGRRGTR